MRIYDTEIKEVKIIDPMVFSDDRGFFFESFNQKKFNEIINREVNFVQDNHSFSQKNTLRGIHYQLPPFAQGKLVRVTQGEVFDIAVDLRRSSPSFGKSTGIILNDQNNLQFWVPEGFGHGFVVLSETATFLYKTTNYYDKESERSIIWNDPDLNIPWGLSKPLISEKDREGKKFIDAEVFE